MLTGALFLAAMALARSQYWDVVARTPLQPVPFSHKHHAGELGIDCRYCHTTVETSANAGFPATHVCMTCHSQLWTNAEMLAPVRQSLAENRPINWHRVARRAGLCLFPPRHPHRQGHCLRRVPRPHRPDAAHLSRQGVRDEVLPRLPPRPRAAPAAARRGLQFRLEASGRPCSARPQADGHRAHQVASRIDLLRDVSSMSGKRIWRSLEEYQHSDAFGEMLKASSRRCSSCGPSTAVRYFRSWALRWRWPG